MKEATSLMRKMADRLFGENGAEAKLFLQALIEPPDFDPWILWTGDEAEKTSMNSMSPPAFTARSKKRMQDTYSESKA